MYRRHIVCNGIYVLRGENKNGKNKKRIQRSNKIFFK